MLNRTETRIAAAATLGPAVLIGALLLGGHHTPADPQDPIVVELVPVYARPAPVAGHVVSA